MVETENIKEVVNQVVAEAAMVIIMVLRDTETGSRPGLMVSHIEPQRQRHSQPELVKPAFNLGTQDRYGELMNFEMEVLNIIENPLSRKKVPVIKKMAGVGRSAVNTNFHPERKGGMKDCKGPFYSIVQHIQTIT